MSLIEDKNLRTDFSVYLNAAIEKERRKILFADVVRIAERNMVDVCDVENLNLQKETEVGLARFGPSGLRNSFISDIFRTSHSKRLLNAFARRKAEEGGPSHFLSGKEFLKRHGPPPRNVLNSIIKRARGLNCSFTRTEGDDPFAPFTAELINNESGNPVKIEDLLLGEKTLIGIARAIYGVAFMTEHGGYIPGLVLFDGVDSASHSGVARHLLDLINFDMMGKMRASVILVTHSPTTIALTPEKALFRMDNRLGILYKISREDVAHELCDGIVVVTGKFRFVFVEGYLDEHCLCLPSRKSAARIPGGNRILEESMKFASSLTSCRGTTCRRSLRE